MRYSMQVFNLHSEATDYKSGDDEDDELVCVKWSEKESQHATAK